MRCSCKGLQEYLLAVLQLESKDTRLASMRTPKATTGPQKGSSGGHRESVGPTEPHRYGNRPNSLYESIQTINIMTSDALHFLGQHSPARHQMPVICTRCVPALMDPVSSSQTPTSFQHCGLRPTVLMYGPVQTLKALFPINNYICKVPCPHTYLVTFVKCHTIVSNASYLGNRQQFMLQQ